MTEIIRGFYEAHPFPDYDETEDVGSLIEKSLARGFPEMLNRSIPPHATVLEVGCGTGQLGNFLSIARGACSPWTSASTRCDWPRRSGRARASSVTFAQMNLFRLPLRPERFDVVVCTGVLHHTSDPRRGFRGLLRHRPAGRLRRDRTLQPPRPAQDAAPGPAAGVAGERLVARDPYLREYGVKDRKRQAWLMDQYRNPHESLHTMDEVLGWFDDDGVEFLRALPGTVFRPRLLARLPALPVRARVPRLPPGSLAQPDPADAHRYRGRAVRHDRAQAMSAR